MEAEFEACVPDAAAVFVGWFAESCAMFDGTALVGMCPVWTSYPRSPSPLALAELAAPPPFDLDEATPLHRSHAHPDVSALLCDETFEEVIADE